MTLIGLAATLLQAAALPANFSPPLVTELAATLLQGVITTGLAALCANLYVRYHRPWFGWFAIAWGVYVARLLCILSFLLTGERVWLYWHQVTTGWTALVLLWASLVFLRQPATKRWYLVVVLFPPLWSYIAIYQLDAFLLAALPAVLFLSGATAWTGWVFWRHHRIVGSPGARLLAVAFAAWGLHHLDYPFLRAQGAWSPWGYYLDICFQLLVGAGLVLLVLDDLGRGVRALSALSGDLQRRTTGADPLDLLLSRPLTLSGVRGSAMFMFDDVPAAGGTHADRTDDPAITAERAASGGRFVRGAGSCATWESTAPQHDVADALSRMRLTRRPQVVSAHGEQPFVAALPVSAGNRLVGALVMAGDVRNPFTALDDDFLLALGQQVGAALEQSTLDRQLAARTAALEQLSTRMVRQHEGERRRLSRELHDETAQVFSAVKMQLEALRPVLAIAAHPRLDRLLVLVDTGIRSIRQVTSALRPSLLDDLGLLPALRSLVGDFAERSGLRVVLSAPTALPALPPDAELALFRALQEALSNVARHADAAAIDVLLTANGTRLQLLVQDDGHGFPTAADGTVSEAEGRMGLTGMRERMLAVGGQVTVRNHDRGAEVCITLPVALREVA
ncbi:MAG TPA: GAF domain-containing sensor histidine kinase [Gemmatimonas sp.]|nr:GAF domain-containing sensor histidine kinase [Gemmatimonas sp.]